LTNKLSTLFDNRGENTVLAALQWLLPLSRDLNVATGNFEIGSFLALEGVWRSLEKIRIVTGDETTKRTRKEITAALEQMSVESIESEKESDDNLTGLAAVRDAITSKRIAIKIYSKAKFHAKAYIMDTKPESPVDYAVVGSSNFTRPGLTQNLELNLFTTDKTHISALRDWYEAVWKEAEDASAELLKVIEPHLREYSPFTVYAKALYEFFAGRETLQDDWEANQSVIYRMLSQYQKDGYHTALRMAERWGGALVCDGVGLGKTFIGLMLLERHVRNKERVLLIVPKSTRESVWEKHWKETRDNPKPPLAYISRGKYGQMFCIHNHTDFGAEGFDRSRILCEADMKELIASTDVIIIDEGHHFRNPNSNRGKHLMRLAKDKKLYMLTATPINNSLDDLYNLINYFAQNRKEHFMGIGINNLRAHFLENEKRMERTAPDKELTETIEAEDFLRSDELLKAVLIQRSRKYVKDSEAATDKTLLFPERQRPRVVNYSLKSVYESLYSEIKDAFDKENPFLTLAIYNTAAYHKDPDKRTIEYQRQVIGLIRTLLLKRLESSFKSFEASVEDLLAKMAKFLKKYDPDIYQAWDTSNKRWWKIVQDHIKARLEKEEPDAEEEDDVPEEDRLFSPGDHDMDSLLKDVQEDMKLLADFLSKIYRRFYVKNKEGEEEDPSRDNKLQQLLKTLREDNILKGNKVVIFTEFRVTARYLEEQIKSAAFDRVEEIDSTRKFLNREVIIKRFAPYYNCTEAEVQKYLMAPINILVTTDVLSEGLNLQDGSLIINYDLHWNPVRLMQRIGRVDRRLDPVKEAALNRPAELEGKIYFWNFLPPKELEDLLHLKQKLDGKILRINKTLGIEGALLTPDDPDMSLKEFNEKYEGHESIEELMNLEKQLIEASDPEFWKVLPVLPRRLFSGKGAGDGFTHIMNRKNEVVSALQPNSVKGLFCAYRMPFKNDGERGEIKWYFREAEGGTIYEGLREIWTAVRCHSETTRKVCAGVEGLKAARQEIEKKKVAPFVRNLGLSASSKAKLICWMEIC
jgi:SNF2 family DNA or RNA helicase